MLAGVRSGVRLFGTSTARRASVITQRAQTANRRHIGTKQQPHGWQQQQQSTVINAKVTPSTSRCGARSTMASIQQRSFHWTRPLAAGNIVPFKLADIGEGIMEVELLRWYVEAGQPIKRFQKVCEVQSDKATVEITSRYDGLIRKLHYNQGQMAKVGLPLIDIEVAGSSSIATQPQAQEQPQQPAAQTQAAPKAVAPSQGSVSVVEESIDKVLTTPAVRRIARENKVDLTKVRGTGKDGRVMKEDILEFIKSPESVQASAAPAEMAAPAHPIPTAVAAATTVPQDRIEPIRGLGRTMIKTMTAAAAVPHLGYCDEIQMDSLMQLRASMKEVAEKRGVTISYMPFFIKAVSLALKQYPLLNSSLSPDLQNIIYKGSHNIGVAMDTPQGLLVPNIKNVQSLSVFEIAAELNRLQKLGKTGKIGPADLTGGTFTLSNIGTIGGTYASPVLMLPEVCIGALGKIQKLPRYTKDNAVVPVNILYISWSADHRVIDGATVANFSNAWKNYLENPQRMIMDMR